MTNEQRAELGKAAKNNSVSRYQYASSESIIIENAIEDFIDGAEWMEQNQWTPVTDQMPRGHYAIRAKLPSQDGNETFHTAFWNGDYFLNGYGREYPPNRSFVTGVLLLQSIDSPPKTTNNG